MVLIVTFEDKTRYLTDVGWCAVSLSCTMGTQVLAEGMGQLRPTVRLHFFLHNRTRFMPSHSCKLEHGAVSHSLVSAESVVLRQEPLPGADKEAMPCVIVSSSFDNVR